LETDALPLALFFFFIWKYVLYFDPWSIVLPCHILPFFFFFFFGGYFAEEIETQEGEEEEERQEEKVEAFLPQKAIVI
jgi:hypothetical protein